MTIKQKDSISKYWNTYYKELFSPDNNGLKLKVNQVSQFDRFSQNGQVMEVNCNGDIIKNPNKRYKPPRKHAQVIRRTY